MQDREHTFTVAFHKGQARPSVHGTHATLERATDLADLFALFGADLPREVNMTFIIDDNPAVMLAYAQRDRMVELSEQGECAAPLFDEHR